jgi:hypothetical protein
MSAHEIEDLVQRSIIVLDKQELESALGRDLIVNLFRFQQHFDCGYTHGRVHKVLLQRKALLPLPLRSHPDAERFAALFARLSDTDEGWLTPTHHADGSSGLLATVGSQRWWTRDAESVGERPKEAKPEFGTGVYFREGFLQLDPGSGTWQRLQARGAFSGLDAVAPERMPPQRVASAVMAAAAAVGDLELVSWWYALLPAVVQAVGEPADIASLGEDADIARMLELVEQTHAFELRSDWGSLRPPREHELVQEEEAFKAFAKKWFALEWSLPPQRNRTPVVLAICGELRAALESGERPGSALARAVDELAEFRDWSSFLCLFQDGFGYGLGGLAPRIKRVVDFSGPQPVVDQLKADAELALQQRPGGER